MGWLSKSRTVIRSLSVFYLFLAILAAVLLVFFIGIIPRNEGEINERAHRVLNQLAANYIQKDGEARALFTCSDTAKLPLIWAYIEGHSQNFQNLDHLPYEASISSYKKDKNKIPAEGSHFEPDGDGKWQWIYYAKRPKESLLLEVRINLRDFTGTMLDSRNDIFENYLLLLDSTPIGKTRNLAIIYSSDEKTPSWYLNNDSLNSLQKNSDGSATGNIYLSGNEYKIFYAPFELSGQKLLLAGLIDSSDYAKRARQTPLDFIPSCIICILLLLMAMPFIKIFLLDRRESLNYQDMALAGISFYFGPVCLMLILFYLVSQLVDSSTYSNRLARFGRDLQGSVEKNIAAAHKRLFLYDSVVTHQLQDARLKKQFINPDDDSEDMNSVDRVMSPISDHHTSRVFWADSAGHTIAKWNPFDFVSPRTDINGYAYFKKFKDLVPPASSSADSFCIVYAGKSNATGEFQVFILKPSEQVFGTDTAEMIVEAMNLDISDHVVLPEGFGFCLADKDGNILVDADPGMNLCANILEESCQNSLLTGFLKGADPGYDIDISIYGQPHSAHVFPIKDQDLFLVAYFDQKITNRNFIRLLLFTIQTIALLALAILLCILLSTFQKTAPGKLLFSLKPVEWIRPVSGNVSSYVFTFYYFGGLFVLYLVFLFILLFKGHDLRPLFFISLLLPFYVIWGFVVSRNHRTDQENLRNKISDKLIGRYKSYLSFISKNKTDNRAVMLNRDHGLVLLFADFVNLLKPGFYPVVFTLCMNLLLSWSVKSIAPVLVFEVFAFFLLLAIMHWFGARPGRRIKNLLKYTASYHNSLMLSMFLVSIFPVMGIILYGYSAEMLQHKKQDLLGYARGLGSWEQYIRDDQSVGYKELVKNTLGSSIYSHDLFLIEGDTANTLQSTILTPIKSPALPDSMYVKLINGANVLGGVDQGFLATGQSSGARNWQFHFGAAGLADEENLILDLRYTHPGSVIPVICARGKINSLGADFFNLPFSLLVFCFVLLILLILLFAALVRATISRLFLRNIVNRKCIRPDRAFLDKIFKQVPFDPPILRGMIINSPVELKFFKSEANFPKSYLPVKPCFSQEDYILALSRSFSTAYERIWNRLEPVEQFTLYDFCKDYYTNYKNVEVFMSLVQKGIILEQGKTWVVFSLSFRQYILSKKGKPEIESMMAQFRVGGTWEAFKVPVLSLIAVAGVVIIATQSELSHQILAVATSLTALIPLLLKMFQGNSAVTNT